MAHVVGSQDKMIQDKKTCANGDRLVKVIRNAGFQIIETGKSSLILAVTTGVLTTFRKFFRVLDKGRDCAQSAISQCFADLIHHLRFKEPELADEGEDNRIGID